MGKVVGIVLFLVGVVILIFSKFVSSLTFISKLPSFAGFSLINLLGAGFILIGIVALFMGGGQSSREVPIYQGNKIIGYRRA